MSFIGDITGWLVVTLHPPFLSPIASEPRLLGVKTSDAYPKVFRLLFMFLMLLLKLECWTLCSTPCTLSWSLCFL
ncbi:hypothetical protein Leryth_026419, partial [Lithospermum erythrorhizon]